MRTGKDQRTDLHLGGFVTVGLLVRLLVVVLAMMMLSMVFVVVVTAVVMVVLLMTVGQRLVVLVGWVDYVRGFLSKDRAHRDKAGNAGDSHQGS